MKETPNEKQNRIFRKMSAEKKIKMVDDFYRFALKLQQTNDHPKIHRANKLRFRPA